jgi:hypothetical protein
MFKGARSRRQRDRQRGLNTAANWAAKDAVTMTAAWRVARRARAARAAPARAADNAAPYRMEAHLSVPVGSLSTS